MNPSPICQYHFHVNREKLISPFIPYSVHVTPQSILTKEGDFLRIWRVGGISHETKDPGEIQMKVDQLNALFRSIGSEHTSIWTHNIRRHFSTLLKSSYSKSFCRQFDEKYYESLHRDPMMINDLYLTLIYRPHPSLLYKAIARSARRSLEEIKVDQEISIKKLNELASQLESSLKDYELTSLNSYEDPENGWCSEVLSFLNFLISGEWQKVRIPTIPLDDYLGTSWVFVGSEIIEIRSPNKIRYMAGIDLKDYVSHTEPGLLNQLMYEPYEYILTQSYTFYSKREGQKYLERQQKQLQNTEDKSFTQIDEMNEAIDDLIQGKFLMGEYHFTLLIIGNTVEELYTAIASAKSILQELGFLAASINTATEAAYYAQLPANWMYRPRIAGLTTKNFSALCSFHNFSTGKKEGNPWGPAVTLFKTPSAQPFFFNFHLSPKHRNNEGQKMLGNTKIIGQSGSGKTVLTLVLLMQSQKFIENSPQGFTSIYFDKDRGAEIAIRAIGGKYFNFKNGIPTGINPFQMAPTEENIVFLEKLTRWIASYDQAPLSTSDNLRISQAVRTVMCMPKEHRRLKIVTQNMTEGIDRENSIVKRLSRWCQGGELGWVLDNPVDLIDFTTHHNYGLDGTHFLDNALIRTPLSMYLLYRMESILDGRRFMYYMDEFWKWVMDDLFSDFAFNKQKTIRKQNGLGVFATQSPEDILKSPIARAIIEQCPTGIFLPNPAADEAEYREGFKLSATEYTIIKHLGENSRLFLVKQGQHSAVAKLDLTGFQEELSLLSGGTDHVEMLDVIRAEVGDDPDRWLPIFHKRRKNLFK